MSLRLIPLLALLVLSGSEKVAGADPQSPTERDAIIARQIARLGSSEFRERIAAANELDRIGPPALPALRQVVNESDDPEVRQRAEDLIARISQRAESEETLAATPITLKAGSRSLAEILDDIRQKTKAEFQVDPHLAKETQLTISTGETQPFWLALEKILDLAGFEITVPGTSSATTPDASESIAADLKRLTDERIAVIERLQKEMKKRGQPGQNAKEIEELDAIIQNLRNNLQKNIQQMAALQARQAHHQRQQAASPQALPVIIALQPRSGQKIPHSIHGAARISAIPFPEAARATVPADQFPVLLQLQSEPKLHCLSIESISIRSAIDDQNRELTVSSRLGSVPVQVQPVKGGNVVIDANGGVNLVPNAPASGSPAFQPNSLQAVAMLTVPGDGPAPRELKSMTGHLRVQVCTPEKVLAKLDELKPGEAKRSTADSPVFLDARLSDALKPGQYDLRVIAKFDPNRHTPTGETPGRTDWANMIQAPGGAIVIQNRVIINGGSVGTNSAEALSVQDAEGHEYQLNLVSASTQITQNGTSREFSREYIVRAIAKDPKAGPPTQIQFRGRERKQVEIPFQFSHLPLIPGTGPRSAR